MVSARTVGARHGPEADVSKAGLVAPGAADMDEDRRMRWSRAFTSTVAAVPCRSGWVLVDIGPRDGHPSGVTRERCRRPWRATRLSRACSLGRLTPLTRTNDSHAPGGARVPGSELSTSSTATRAISRAVSRHRPGDGSDDPVRQHLAPRATVDLAHRRPTGRQPSSSWRTTASSMSSSAIR